MTTPAKTYHGDRPCLPPECYPHLWNTFASDETPLRLQSTVRPTRLAAGLQSAATPTAAGRQAIDSELLAFLKSGF
jgi:hypothetical protein